MSWTGLPHYVSKDVAAILLIMLMPVSCNWLDVIPDNMPTIDDAFSNRATAERSLFSCYRYIPDPTDPFIYPAYCIHRDEFDMEDKSYLRFTPVITLYRNGQNGNDPILDYWSGRNGGTSMFEAIRTCNLFLEGIHLPRDITEYERKKWIAEVKFLKAYYHFFLLQLYGPVPIIRESLSISAKPDEVKVFREPVDECIAYIVELIDEAAPDLPLVITNTLQEHGRITQPIALGVKAKALAWGASPLFNGNPVYKDWRDSRGKQLISDTENPEKWVKAAAAIREAIDASHQAGHELYLYNRLASTSTYRMNDSLILTMHTRKAITDRWNSGVLWSSTKTFGDKPSSPGWYPYADLQRAMFTKLYAEDANSAIHGIHASFNMAELFYSSNGIPIDEDIHWDYDNRYQLKVVDNEHMSYMAVGEQTAALHFNREPRFYANLAFNRGYYELATSTTDGGVTFTPYLRFLAEEPGYGTGGTGYFVKKMIAFESSASRGSLSITYTGYDYRFPMLRLADLYLLYSEALNEMKNAPDAEVYKWIDEVRAITGLKGVVESWKNSKNPNRTGNKDEMRKIIQQERLIELAFEGQRFWDMRRWKLAENTWSYKPQRWATWGRTAEEYYHPNEHFYLDGRKYTFRDYLWPINTADLRVNTNLVQTYGW